MLVYASKLLNTPVLSMQAAAKVASLVTPIVEPETLKIIAFYIAGPFVNKNQNILDSRSIREYSPLGCVVDSEDEFIERNDVIKIKNVLDKNFDLIGLKVVTKKGTKLGHIIDYTVTSNDFTIEQLIVKRPLLKSFTDSTLVIPRKEIIEVTDTTIVIKDEEDIIKQKAMTEDFIPNFVNPFRKTELSPSPTRTKSPAEQDIE